MVVTIMQAVFIAMLISYTARLWFDRREARTNVDVLLAEVDDLSSDLQASRMIGYVLLAQSNQLQREANDHLFCLEMVLGEIA